MRLPEIVVVEALPLRTFVGVKYEETVDTEGHACEHCPFLEDCREDVYFRDGFAWCEEAIPVDLDPAHRTVGRGR